jgi:hypothetical protein
VSRTAAHEATIKDRILASLLTLGPASHLELAGRLVANDKTVRRELAEMVAREEIHVLRRQFRPSVGRAAYIYAHPDYAPTDEERTERLPFIQPSSPEVVEVVPRLFSAPTDPLPRQALLWNPEYQQLWRNGLKTNGR